MRSNIAFTLWWSAALNTSRYVEEKMKAVRFHASKDVRFEDVPVPSSIGDHQVLMKPTLCGICGTDLHEYIDGPHWTPRPRNEFSGATLPQILGHEFAGEVLEVGKKVARLRPGD